MCACACVCACARACVCVCARAALVCIFACVGSDETDVERSVVVYLFI